MSGLIILLTKFKGQTEVTIAFVEQTLNVTGLSTS